MTAAIAASVLAGCAPATTDTPPDLAITNVHVVDVATGELLRDRTVTIRDGRIDAILAADEGAAAASDAIDNVDGAGRYMVPGLWDMHVHFRGGAELIAANRALLPLYIANGVTTVRDAGGDMTTSVLEWDRQAEAGDIVGPRILTSGPKLDGPTGGWDGSIRLTAPEDVPAAIDSLQSLGVDYVKIYDGTTSRDVFLAILDETERRGMIATGHMPFTVKFAEAVDHGLDATEHLYSVFKGSALNEDSVTAAVIATENTDRSVGFWGGLSLLRPRYDEELARSTFRHMVEEGTAVLPTLHIGRVLSWVEETDHANDPELRYIDPGIVETYAGRVNSARGASAASRRERRALQEMFIDMVPVMHEEGVTILAGSDAGVSNSHVYPGFSLHAELEELAAAGIPPADVLRIATMEAAEFMRLGNELGRVEPGYRADLALLRENPLEDIRNTRSVDLVILGGRTVLDRAALDELLESVAR